MPNTTAWGSNPEIRLAIGLLQIAKLAMPDTFYARDSRCQLAREILSKHGIDEEQALKG